MIGKTQSYFSDYRLTQEYVSQRFRIRTLLRQNKFGIDRGLFLIQFELPARFNVLADSFGLKFPTVRENTQRVEYLSQYEIQNDSIMPYETMFLKFSLDMLEGIDSYINFS